MRRFVIFCFIFVAFFFAMAEEAAPAADANAEVANSTEAAPAEPHHFIYFKPKLSVSFLNNHSVSGKTDGIYFQTDLDIVFNYKYVMNIHEFLGDLNLKEGLSYTPMFSGLVIASDLFKVDARYNAMFHKYVGFYAKAGLETHFFPGYDYRSDETAYTVAGTKKSGTTKKFKLTPSGLPLYLTQGAGIFTRPVDKEYANLEIALGLAAREVIVGDSLVVDDDGGTDEREVSELTNIYDAGGELTVTFKGMAEQNKIAYELMVRAMMPFYSKDRAERDLTWGDLFQLEAKARVDFNVNQYLAFYYEFNLKRDFQVIKKWQMTNGLYLSLYYELDKKM